MATLTQFAHHDSHQPVYHRLLFVRMRNRRPTFGPGPNYITASVLPLKTEASPPFSTPTPRPTEKLINIMINAAADTASPWNSPRYPRISPCYFQKGSICFCLRRGKYTNLPRIGKKKHQGMVDHSCKNQAVAGHVGIEVHVIQKSRNRPVTRNEDPLRIFLVKKTHLFNQPLGIRLCWQEPILEDHPRNFRCTFFQKLSLLEFRFSQMGLYMAVGSFLSDTATKGQAVIIPHQVATCDVSAASNW